MKNERIKSKDQKLRELPIPKLLLNMAIPMVIAMVVNGLYYLVDAAFVGWAVNSIALGGLAVVFPLQMLAVALATMIGVGSASIVSINLGLGKKSEATSAVKNGFLYSGMLGIAIPLSLMIFKSDILKFM